MDLNWLGNSKSVALEQRGELTLLRIDNSHADAVIALQGAQVLEFTPKDQRPLIWLSATAEYKRGQSIRGGIPVCWPWFGDIKRNPDAIQKMAHGGNLPAHGLVRTHDWMIDTIDERSNATVVVLRYTTMATIQSEWPHDATLTLTISIGKTLQLQLTTRNDSRSELAIAQALHTYFPVSDIRGVEVRGFEQTRFIDTLDVWREHIQNDAIRFVGETDRIYLDVPPRVELVDHDWQRSIFLDTRNSYSAIVWNPWIEKSQRLSQFDGDAWQRMVCIETANACSDSVTLRPGAEHTLALEISA